MHFNATKKTLITKLLKHEESELERKKSKATHFACLEAINCIQYLEHENILVLGLKSGALLSVSHKAKYKEAPIKHSEAITTLGHCGSCFLAASLNGEISMWRICWKTSAPEFLGWIHQKEANLGMITLDINHHYVIACKSSNKFASQQHKVMVWKRDQEFEIPNVMSVASNPSEVFCLQVKENKMFAGFKSGSILMSDVQQLLTSGSEVKVSASPIWALQVVGDKHFVLAAARNEGVFKVDCNSNEVCQVIQPFQDLLLQISVRQGILYCLTNFGQIKKFSLDSLENSIRHSQSLDWNKQFGMEERKSLAYHSICYFPNFQVSDRQLFVISPDDTRTIKLLDLDLAKEEQESKKQYFMKMDFHPSNKWKQN